MFTTGSTFIVTIWVECFSVKVHAGFPNEEIYNVHMVMDEWNCQIFLNDKWANGHDQEPGKAYSGAKVLVSGVKVRIVSQNYDIRLPLCQLTPQIFILRGFVAIFG